MTRNSGAILLTTALAFGSGIGHAAAAPEARAEDPKPEPKPTSKSKLKLSPVDPVSAGANVTLEAKLMYYTPIPGVEPSLGSGLPVSFRLEATRGGPAISPAIVQEIGTADTKGGVATIRWVVPQLKPGSYAIRASYAGVRGKVGPSSDTTPLVITSAASK